MTCSDIIRRQTYIQAEWRGVTPYERVLTIFHGKGDATRAEAEAKVEYEKIMSVVSMDTYLNGEPEPVQIHAKEQEAKSEEVGIEDDVTPPPPTVEGNTGNPQPVAEAKGRAGTLKLVEDPSKRPDIIRVGNLKAINKSWAEIAQDIGKSVETARRYHAAYIELIDSEQIGVGE